MKPSNSMRYQICTRCVMDTSDPLIEFDSAGVCNHCRTVDAIKSDGRWMPDARGARHLEAWVQRIKRMQASAEYDCIIGMSGGVDSSYLAVVAHRLGLRCLAVHVDAGWNSEIAVGNIERILRALNMDLVTHIVDWEEMQDLQVAFLRSGVPNQDIPQDHIFFSFLYTEARKRKINFQLQGRNYASESVLPRSWGYSAMDGIHLKRVHRLFGSRPLKRYKVMSVLDYVDYFAGLPWRSQLEIVDPLNFIPYDPASARVELQRDFGWRDYGEKHWESHWTRFFQSYLLPVKFGCDKRRAHMSSLILSGALTRANALRHLQKPSYDPDTVWQDQEFVRRKLGIDAAEWKSLMEMPPKAHIDYDTGEKQLQAAMRAALMIKEFNPNLLARVAKKAWTKAIATPAR